MVSAIGVVGSKGELYPPRRVREAAGIAPGDKVLYIAASGRITVIRIPSLDEAFSQKSFAKATFRELEEMTGEVLPTS